MRRRNDGYLSASELARLGYCERQVALDAAFGKASTPAQRDAQRRGRRAHTSFYRESLRIAKASETKGRCFIAGLTLGECDETKALRAFRDLYLRRSAAGRSLIGTYYRAAPSVCRWMTGRPVVLAIARALLRMLAAAAAAAVRKALRS